MWYVHVYTMYTYMTIQGKNSALKDILSTSYMYMYMYIHGILAKIMLACC